MDQSGISESETALDRIFSSDYLESFILNLIPAGVYVTDMSGIIRKYNEQASLLWGRWPIPGDINERYNGAWRLYYPDGTPLPHDQTPAAQCLKDGLPRKDIEVIIERPDLSRIYVQVNVMPAYDKQ